MADSTVIRGIVKAVSTKYGGALTFGEQGPDGKGVWLSYSKPEYREMAFYEPSAGDNVEVIVSWASTGKGYIKSIVPLNGTQVERKEIPYPDANEQWPDDPPLSAYGDIPERDVNQDVAPRRKSTDESIQLQVAVKAATEITVALMVHHGKWIEGSPEETGARIAAMASAIAQVYEE